MWLGYNIKWAKNLPGYKKNDGTYGSRNLLITKYTLYSVAKVRYLFRRNISGIFNAKNML